MHITEDMIHPELVELAKQYSQMFPCYTEEVFKQVNQMDANFVGKAGDDVTYRQVWIERPEAGIISKKCETDEQLRICVYQPKEQAGPSAGVLWLHGGGYAMTVPEMEEFFAKIFTNEGCTVVAPDYRRSMDAPYPAAIEDCYAALEWMSAHAEELNIKPDQLMVAGDSAGGGLTAALCVLTRDVDGPKIAYQMPLYPMLDDRMITESASDNDAPVWNTPSNINGWRLYLGYLFETEDVPVYAAAGRLEDFHGLPPATLFVGSIEPFRDEAVAWIESLKAAGIDAEYRIMPGCFHCFDVLAPESTPAREAHAFLVERLRYAFEHFHASQE